MLINSFLGTLEIENGKDTNWHREKDSEQNSQKTIIIIPRTTSKATKT